MISGASKAEQDVVHIRQASTEAYLYNTLCGGYSHNMIIAWITNLGWSFEPTCNACLLLHLADPSKTSDFSWNK